MNSYSDGLRFAGITEIVPSMVAVRGRPFNDILMFREVDLTAATLWKAQVRAFPDAGGAALASFTIPAPTLEGGTDTRVSLQLDAGATGGLPAGSGLDNAATFYFDLIATVEGSVTTLAAGQFLAIGRIAQ